MLHFECPVCQPSLYCLAVFSAEFCSFRKNSANQNISQKFVQPAELKKPAEGSGADSKASEWSGNRSGTGI